MVPDTSASSRIDELRRVALSKRRVYSWTLVCAAAIVLLSWWFRSPEDLFLAYVYPAVAVACMVLLVPLWRRTVPMRSMEMVLLGFGAGVILSRLAWHFHAPGSIEDRLLDLIGGHYWAVALLIVSTIGILDRYRGLLFGLLIITASAILAGSGLLMEASHSSVAGETVMKLARVHIFLIALLALVASVALLRDQLRSAIARAENWERWANTDPLSGLANRRAGERFLQEQAALATQNASPLSVLLLDIDRFKRINDTNGHAVGDAVLAAIAERLTDGARRGDLVTRWGGEEFLIIAPHADIEDAGRIGERIRREVEQRPMAGVQCSVTVGIAQHRPGEQPHHVVSRADICLYQGKATGRNRVMTAVEGAAGTDRAAGIDRETAAVIADSR